MEKLIRVAVTSGPGDTGEMLIKTKENRRIL